MEESDCLSKAGATRLAETIAQYWSDRGFAGVRTAVASFPIPWRLRRGDQYGYRVVSNIGPNGYPPRKLAIE